MSVTTKGGGGLGPGNRPGNFPGRDTRTDDTSGGSIIDTSKQAESGVEKTVSGFYGYLNALKEDKTGSAAAVSALDIWFGGIVDAIQDSTSTWLAKLALLAIKMGPLIAALTLFAVKAAWTITAFKMVGTVVKAAIDVIKGIGDAIKSLNLYAKALYKNAVANEINAVANLVKQTGMVLISLAVSTAIFVAAAYAIKELDLEDTLEIMAEYVKDLLIAVAIIMSLYALINSVDAVFRVLREVNSMFYKINVFLGKTKDVVQRPRDTITSVFHEMALILFALVAGLGVVAAAVYFIGQMKLPDIAKGVITIGILGSIAAGMMFALMKFSKEMTSYMYSYENIGIQKHLKGKERAVERDGTVIHRVLLSFAGLMAVMTASVVIFGKMKPHELQQGMYAFWQMMLGLTIFLGVLLFATRDFTDKSVNLDKVAKDITTGTNANALGALPAIITAIGAYMWAVSRAIKAMKGMSSKQIQSATALIGVTMGTMAGLMAVIAETARQKPDIDVGKLKTQYDGMAKVIGYLSIFFLSLSASLYIMSYLSGEELRNGILTLIGAMVGISLFMIFIPKLLSYFKVANKLKLLANSMVQISIGLSILLLAVAATFYVLQSVDWSKMEGSWGYLLGVGSFIAAMTFLVGVMTVFVKGNPGAIVAATLSTFGGLTLLMFGISKLFLAMAQVPWAEVQKAWPFLAGLGALFTVVTIAAIIIAAGGPIAMAALGAIATYSLMFLSLGGMFLMIGMCVDMIGDGVDKISMAIERIVQIPWGKVDEAGDGFRDLMRTLRMAAESMDAGMILGALEFAGFVSLMAFAINKLAGVDQRTVKEVGMAINTFLSTIAEDIEEKEAVIKLLTGMSEMFPLIAGSLAASAVILAIGGLGLIAFAAEMIIFVNMIDASAEQIAPAIGKLVQAIVDSGNLIFNQGLELLAGFAGLFAVGTLAIVVGTLLTVGGALMSTGAFLIYMAGSTLQMAIETMIEAIEGSSEAILQNAAGLLNGARILSAFGVLMAVVGTILTVGGTAFLIGAGLVAAGAGLLKVAVNSFGQTSVAAATYAANTVAAFDMIVQNAEDLVYDLTELGEAMEYAGEMATEGFIRGISRNTAGVFSCMSAFGTGIIDVFNGTLGIASPATEFIESAFWSAYGFIDGLTENTPAIQDTCVSIVEGVVGIFDGAADGTGEAGEDSALSFGTGVSDMVEQYLPDLEAIFDSLGIDLGDLAGYNMEDRFGKHMKSMVDHAAEIASHVGYGYWTSDQRQAFGHNPNSTNLSIADVQQANAYNNQAYSDWWWANYVPTDKEDVSYGWLDANDYYKSFGGGGGSSGIDTTSALASSISGSSGAGSGINDQSKAASIGGGVGNTITNSNNTYNFNQYNYSPEPLNRSAIYQQTRQQFNGFYTYAKEKGLSY